MNAVRTRASRLVAITALVLGLGAAGAGPALAGGTWAGSIPDSSMAADVPDTSHHG